MFNYLPGTHLKNRIHLKHHSNKIHLKHRSIRSIYSIFWDAEYLICP